MKRNFTANHKLNTDIIKSTATYPLSSAKIYQNKSYYAFIEITIIIFVQFFDRSNVL